MLENINTKIYFKDLILDVPIVNDIPYFNPDIHLSKQTKEDMIEHYRQTGGNSESKRINALPNGLYLKLMLPSLFSEQLNKKLSWESKTCIKKYNQLNWTPRFSNYSSLVHGVSSIGIIAAIKTLLPEVYDNFYPTHYINNIHQEEKKKILLENDFQISKHLSNLFGLGVVDYPRFIKKTLPNTIQLTKENYQEFYDSISIKEPLSEIGLRAFFPQDFQKYKHLIDWDEWHWFLQQHTNSGYWDSVIPLATSMYILSAQEVTIDK